MREAAIVHEDRHVRLAYASGGQQGIGRVLLSFTGIGHALGGIDVQRPEFGRAAALYDGIFFISDLTRSWGNSLDFAAIRQVVAQIAPDASYDTLGNSMGGFLALLAPSLLPVRHAIAFAPQFSMKPDIVPFETRWADYTGRIQTWVYPSLDGVWQDRTRYYIFTGSHGPDRKHADLFPPRDNIVLTRVPGGHDVALDLKNKGLLHDVIRDCCDGTYDRDAAQARFQTTSP